jgi:predicted Ser/Thr protein kinase
MLTDQDVLLLKLALERELLTSAGYRQVLGLVRKSPVTGGVGRAFRQVGITGDKVADLAERAMAAVKDPRGVILARCDLEDALVARALERAKLVTAERLDRARNELTQVGRTGELTSLSEVLVKRRWLDVPIAVELRKRARERVATCPKCFLQYIVEPDKASTGRYRCRTCGSGLVGGKGCHSAVEVARGIIPEKPPPPIEASQMVTLSTDQQAALKEARERGLRAEAERLAAARPRAEQDTVTTPAKKIDEDSDAPATARWESVHDLDDEKAPTVAAAVASFGEYEILSEVARGGMGIIYKARRKGAQKLLALKVLISGVDATQDQVDRFEREGENARKLRHPNIVRVYDAGRHEGYHYIAMEFVEGVTLESQLTKGALEPRRAARVIRDVARAVDHIHKAGIIHRDLKPGNIILNDADVPKLIDFGLAKSIDRRAKLTRSGAAIGTPYYMPPEQVRGESDKVGPPSDVYALGAILFEMLVGDVPFKAENPVELYHKIASSELVLPDRLRDGLAPELVTIVAKSMEKEPGARYATAADLADDLDRFLDGKPLTARRPGGTGIAKAMKRAKRTTTIVALGLVIVLAIAGLVAVALKFGPRGPDRAVQLLVDQGRSALAGKRYEEARIDFENAIRMSPDEPSLEVDLARALAPHDKDAALTALEKADRDGLRDASLLDAIELKGLEAEARFRTVCDRVKARR